MSVPRLRTVLKTLKDKPLPACPEQIDRMLKARGERIKGRGRQSTQQRKMALLELMVPSLKMQLGTNTIETGDYKWGDHLAENLGEAISKYLAKWVPKPSELPFCYDSTTEYLWLRRRQSIMMWVQSPQGRAFCKQVYKAYAASFTSVIKDCARNSFTSALEVFFQKKRRKEEGELHHLLQTLLQHLCQPCICTVDNVVDTFSFVIRNLYIAVFKFFSIKVRKVPVVKVPKRLKDREDDAKTYYICGVALASLITLCKRKPSQQSEKLLASVNALTVEPKIAAKLGLPTRHVTIKNRGGLLFASKQYYELMCKIEMRFYSTVVMRQNFALARPDVIANIKKELLQDCKMFEEFKAMIPHEAFVLWEMLVERIANLHGTELAAQQTEGLAALKRKSTAAKIKPQKRTVSVKHESLRAARKQKKLHRVNNHHSPPKPFLFLIYN